MQETMKTPKCPVPDIRCSVVLMEHIYAGKLLQTNPSHQRNISPANLRKIEASYRKDEFMLNRQPIILDEAGKLLDGQHRLQACVNTRIGFWTVLVEGIPSEYFKYMDCGKSRSFSDVLKTMGIPSTKVTAATLSRLAEYLRDPQCLGTSAVFAHSELLDVHSMSPGLDDSIRFVKCCEKMLPASQAAWLHYLGKSSGVGETNTFFIKLAYGSELTKDDAIHQLRTRILNDKEYGFHPAPREMLALLVKTWNAFVRGQPMKRLAWQTNEDFPILDLPKSP